MNKIINDFFNLNSYPTKKWVEIEKIIKNIGEKENFVSMPPEDINFLHSIGFINIIKTLINTEYALSDIGLLYFEEVFIRNNLKKGKEILCGQLLKQPPVIAIQQYLFGVKDPSIFQVITVLKSVNFWESDIKLAHFLDLLNSLEIITYNRKAKIIKILIPPDTEKIPPSIFIDPQRPYSNIMWIKKIISKCRGYLYWIDKHFQKEAFEWIFASADANKINEIKILSLDLKEDNKNATKEYGRLKKELENKGINLEWHVIDSTFIKDSHDRWIISENEARNIPNVNAISSGQKSELNLSENKEILEKDFLEYWEKSYPKK
jgi:hypothetical protein